MFRAILASQYFFPKRKSNRNINLEQLESRLLCTANSLGASFAQTESHYADQAIFALQMPGEVGANAKPTVAKPIAIKGAVPSNITSTRVSISVLGTDDGGERKLTYTWDVISKPADSNPQFTINSSNSAKNSALLVDRVGTYNLRVSILDAEGKFTTKTQTIRVNPVAKSFMLIEGENLLKSGSTLTTTEKSQKLSVQAYDQFGQTMKTPSSTTWTLTSKPSGSDSTISGSGANGALRFDKAGRYAFRVSQGSTKFTGAVVVEQVLTKISVSANTDRIDPGARARFTVSGLDQFRNRMSQLPAASWSVSGGQLTSSGQYTAPKTPGTYRVVATIDAFTAQASIRVATIPQTSNVLSLTQSYFADGSINRADMIAILRSAGSDGSVNTLELSQMRTIVSNAASYNMPDYVRALADNVVNTNPANAKYQGATLGNLAAGSNATQLNRLVDKWFVGTDLPALKQVSGAPTIAYATASGSLFSGLPSLTDQKQGLVGDCYVVSGLGSLANVNPTAVQNMFVDNGDGTFTVRFYAGALNNLSTGFVTGSGVADYVTVNLQLPAYSNGLYFAYSNFGQLLSSPANSLWIALAEKAYAQWNETGRAGQDGTNSYAGIEGGWMGIVYAQVLGYNSSNYSTAVDSNKSQLISALNANLAVTIGTRVNALALVQGHAYTVTGYDAGTDKFTLYNPWGNTQPSGPMSWDELKSNCDFFSTINPSGSVSVSGIAGVQKSSVVDWSNQFDTTQSVGTLATITLMVMARDQDFVEANLSAHVSDHIHSGNTNTNLEGFAEMDEYDSELVAQDDRTEHDIVFDLDMIDDLLSEMFS